MRRISFALLEGAGRITDAGPTVGRLLDAGCGTGSILGHLSRHGRAVGVDIAEEAIGFCRQRGATVARAGLLALPFPAETFDCVTSFDVIYHRWVTDDRAAVAELTRVLRPGGLLLVRVPALQMLTGAHDQAVLTRHRYSRPELRRLFESAGLEVLRASYANTFLFPLVALRRGLDRLTGRHGSDVGFLPRPLEWAFRSLLTLEAMLVRRLSLPLGASVLALGRKPR
jgi:SAM-dependent methyltransferase